MTADGTACVTAYGFAVHDVADSALPPWQAGFRFLIELAALTCWAVVGWHVGGDPARFVLVAALPLAAATLWGTFRVPGDQSASGEAPVAVAGPIRLLLELGVLEGAAVATGLVWRPVIGVVLGVLILVHYVTTPKRVRWLLDQRPPS